MVSYQPIIHETAERELQALPDPDRNRLTQTLKDIATHEEITTHKKVKSLTGQDGMYRVRVGDTRAVIELAKPSLCVWCVGKRNSVYENIDDTLNERRASA